MLCSAVSAGALHWARTLASNQPVKRAPENFGQRLSRVGHDVSFCAGLNLSDMPTRKTGQPVKVNGGIPELKAGSTKALRDGF